jgi:UDP-N-acetylmuramoyl-tripeptide--D-alanyl-D-alanine ligase
MATAIPRNQARFTVDEIARHTGGRVLRTGNASTGVSTDSRSITKGCSFVALTGERFDGHAFTAQAAALGASTLVVARDDVAVANAAVILVDDTRVALGRLALAHRQRWGESPGSSRPRLLVAITGSAGKTTCKRVVAMLLEAAAPGAVHSSFGNLNNDVGVPMTLLGLEDRHVFAVVEVGTSGRGEIRKLAEIARPDVALVTLVASAHTAGLGTVDDVGVEKGALFAALGEAGIAVANADDPRVMAQVGSTRARSVVTFGFAEAADYRILLRESLGRRGARLVFRGPFGNRELIMPLLGEAGAMAAAAGLAIVESVLGRELGSEELERAIVGLSAGHEGRLTLRPLADGTLVLDDSYNANPSSMRASIVAAIEVANHERRRLVLVLGEMRELGRLASAEHAAVGRFAAELGASYVLAIGGEAARTAEEAQERGVQALFAPTADQAILPALAAVHPGDVVLVKGSRAIATEKIVAAMVERGALPLGAGGGAK